jgi:hypothetical protein|tara:strand:- start:1372 stop:2526 length:1155 start_codon:yes stop_codon:yes gene_type:complete
MAQEPIWPGSGSAVSGNTPFGFYDTDSEFQGEAPKFATWCAQRLGFPLMNVELQDKQFYACLEESVSEYSAQINQFNIKDNLLSLQGQSTSSNLTHKRVTPNLGRSVYLSQAYGTEAGVGGLVDVKSGSVDVVSGSQTYDLNALWADVSESGNAIELKKVFYEETPAVQRYFDPYAGTGAGSMNLLDQFGFGNYSPAVTFLMMPVYADMLRLQAIELNDQIRKSAYSFQLRNNKLRIFPRPDSSYKLHFEYVVRSERDDALVTEYSGSSDVISDFSNVPYDNMKFTNINDVGKQWIRKYGLALTKELLGIVRSKYGAIPIPGAETSLDGDTLRSEASAEKEALVTQLREILEQSSRKALMEADKDESEFLQEKLKKVPYPIYIG